MKQYIFLGKSKMNTSSVELDNYLHMFQQVNLTRRNKRITLTITSDTSDDNHSSDDLGFTNIRVVTVPDTADFLQVLSKYRIYPRYHDGEQVFKYHLVASLT